LARLLVNHEPWLNWRHEWGFQGGPFGTPTAVRSPGLPVFLAFIYSLVGVRPQAARLILVLLNAAAAGLLFAAARKAWGTATAAPLTAAWTFWPVSVHKLYYIDSLLSETLAIPLIILALWALTRESTRAAVLAGFALGCAILTRSHLALAA